jgi:hypothetical protein
MRRQILAGIAALAVLVPPTLAVATTGGVAGASGTSHVACAKGTGSVSSNTETFGKCSPKNKAFKTGSTSVSELASGTATITWSGGATTTISITTTSGGTACGSSSHEVQENATGTVTGDTGAAVSYTPVGDAVSATTCLDTKNDTTKLAKGTTADF